MLARHHHKLYHAAERCLLPPGSSSPAFPSAVCTVQGQAFLTQAETSTHNSQSGWSAHWPCLAALPFALAPLAASCDNQSGSEPHKKDNFSFLGLQAKRRVFFKYEKRIRDNSTLRKSFDYFSNLEQDGQKFMLPRGLLAALVPTYPASQSSLERAGSLDGERLYRNDMHTIQESKAACSIFDKFDINGDGLLSFREFLLVLALLSIPEDDVSVIFSVVDVDGSGTIDAEEFTMIMDQTMTNLPKASTRQKKGKEHVAGLLASFFGHDLQGHLKLHTFIDFLRKLHNDLNELEFLHYDVKNKGSIPGIDFAHSLVACSNIRGIDVLLDKVEMMPEHLAQRQVSRTEFISVLNLSQKKHPLIVALQFVQKMGRQVTKAELARIARQTTGTVLSPTVLDIIYEVLGNSEGHLDVGTFVDILIRRGMMYNIEQRSKDSNFKFW